MKSGYRIVLVEDEGLIALDLRNRLEAVGYIVEGIEDSAAGALELTGRSRPDLVLMDIRIKGPRDGIWTANEIRQRFDIPVVFLTAHADAVTVAGARLAEPYGYVVKPFHNIDFHSLVETVVWKHRRDREQRLRLVWENAVVHGAGQGLIAVVPDGSVAFLNEHAETLTGCPAEAAVGLSLLEVLPLYDAETGQPAVTPIEEIAEGREPDERPVRYVLRRALLDPIVVDVRFGVHHDESGFVAVVVSFADVTGVATLGELARRGEVHREVVSLADGFGQECRARFDSLARELETLTHAPADQRPALLEKACQTARQGAEFAAELSELSRPLPLLDGADLHSLVTAVIDAERQRPGLRPDFIVHLAAEPLRILTARSLCVLHLTRLFHDLRYAFPGRGRFRIRTALDSTSLSPVALLIIQAEPYAESAIEISSAVRFRLSVCEHFLTATGGNAESHVGHAALRISLQFPVAPPAAVPVRPPPLVTPAPTPAEFRLPSALLAALASSPPPAAVAQPVRRIPSP